MLRGEDNIQPIRTRRLCGCCGCSDSSPVFPKHGGIGFCAASSRVVSSGGSLVGSMALIVCVCVSVHQRHVQCFVLSLWSAALALFPSKRAASHNDSTFLSAGVSVASCGVYCWAGCYLLMTLVNTALVIIVLFAFNGCSS